MDDRQLLSAYLSKSSTDAFSQIVRQNIDLVYSAARRQLGDSHLAEDVTQAVFLLLSRKAARVKGPLAGWLLTATHFASRDAKKLAARREYHERQAALMRPEQAVGSDEPPWETYAPILDDAMARLKASDRDAIALRYLRGLSLEQVGMALGINAKAAEKRVGRAIGRLRAALALKAAVPAVAALATQLAARGSEAAPAKLAETIAVSGTSVAKGSLVSTIARKAGQAMYWTTAKIAAMALATVTVAGAGTGTFLILADNTPPAVTPSALPPASPSPRAAEPGPTVQSPPPVIASAAKWTNWNNGQPIGSFFAIAGTAKETVAVGIDGHIATRNNSTGVWAIQVYVFNSLVGDDPDFRAIVYANNQYVVVREMGSIMTSPDGIQWTNRASPTKKNLLGLLWDGHQYLACGDEGTILSSPDGITWTSRNSGSRINFNGLSYSGTRYVAVGMDGIRISSDSVTWTKPTSAPESVWFTSCTWSGAEFLACELGSRIYTSPDGDVWTLRATIMKTSLRTAITINGALYVAGDSVVEKSADGGTTWRDIYPISGENKLFMGLASNGENLIAAGFNHNVWAMPLSGPDKGARSK
ncbi:MAG: sigma-70 family RNA polymerase sigma factor [Tepidisphaeraceae bacterium]